MVFVNNVEYSSFITDIKQQIDTTELSVFTKKTIYTALNKINKVTENTFTKEVMEVLHKKLSDNVNSKHTFIASIKSIIKNTNLKNTLSKTELSLIDAEFIRLKEMKENKQYTPTATDKQEDRHIPFKNLKLILNDNKNKLTELEFLTYALYTYQEPLRADYNAIKILNDKYDIDDLDTEENYYSIKDNKFIMYEYKSKNINQKPIVFNPPADLQKIIIKSLKSIPRQYLIYNEKIGSVNKPITANFLSHKIQDISKKLFNEVPISINDFRHSWATENNLQTKSYSEVKASADKMGHSVQTANLIYKKEYKNP